MSLFWATVSLRGEDISTTHKLLYLQKSGVKARRLAQIYKEKKKKGSKYLQCNWPNKKKKVKVIYCLCSAHENSHFSVVKLEESTP